ncbi:hypothetical protein BST97_09720 [Nonlabens spongiae]|uniref:Helix-turn-helix domain-containing protein n=1 Tax=Nonlabens spongiae TaxID=331648 RepID=A0A1W6MKZ5_9FLAO|nr:helix-turn-helix domain-containing protein [Nonlabens spongiae]ARN78247.1 hypothetical protein BST97_09720 [Nonlabens spongiae]
METIENKFFTKEQLERIAHELSGILPFQKEFLSVAELSIYLGISMSAVYKLTSKNEIPFYCPGGKKIYFKKQEINQWIEESRVIPDSEILENGIGSNSLVQIP